MILKSLELQGFKTFPEKTTLTFEQGITSVVGPNGSGKSNISDAIRWVLGEQSVRALRCSKMEDVIFSGTPQRKALGFAEVTLTIDNADRRLPFDSDTVAVTRRYYRSGESEYLLNKTIVRLKDINELFMDTGLGRDGYSMIGQGKIDSIVAARSEDRREIFEEAAGISRYRYRKEEAERRLGRAEENLVRLRDILEELEGRVGPLKEQAEKAEQFIALDEEKKGLEIGVWLATLERSGKTLREHGEKMELAKSQMEQAAGELEEVARREEENTRKTQDCTVAMERLREEAVALDEQAVRAEAEIDLIRNNIEHGQRDMARIREQIDAAARSGDAIEQEIAEKREAAAAKEAEIARHSEQLIRYTESLENLRQGADETTREIEQAALAAARLAASLSEQRVALSSAQSAMGEIRLRAGAVAESLAALKDREEHTAAEGAELDRALDETQKAIAAGENAVRGYELRAQSREKRVQAAKDELDRLTLDVNEQLRRARLLEDLERNLEGFGQSVKAVMREANRGILSGVCGPVSRLLKVPGEYAVALETALGGAMQNIVVEREQDAKAAIQLLKQRDLGRATFLPVDVIRGSVLDDREMEGLPGFVGVASRLCQCDPKYDQIRDSLLGRVAVADTLDSAAAIARRTRYRYRVVSLDGQIVNAGGSMTGGSRARNSGLLSRASEIERIRQKAAELQKNQAQAEDRWKEAQREASAAAGELEAARGELHTLQEDRIRITAECQRVERELSNLHKEREDFTKEQSSSAERLADLEAGARAVEEKIAGLEDEAQAAAAESERLTGSREELLARSEEISRTVSDLRMNVFSAQTERDLLQNHIAELAARKENSGGEILRLREEIAALEAQEAELAGQIDGCNRRAEELRGQSEAKRRQAQETGEKRTGLEQEAAGLRARERELLTTRENAASELARLTERSENLQKEYDGILTRLWEEYELTRREAEEVGAPIEDMAAAQRRLTDLKNRIRALGVVNVGAVVEYKEVHERYTFLKGQIEDAEKSKAELLDLIQDLTKHMREQFTARFAEINRHFGSIFRELFGGGAAELSITEGEDVLTSGIEIKVHPPGKIVTHIESLSGGEKALVAICIYFAIMRVNPPPFCVLDEIEAALDDVNVSRYAQYLRRMSGNTQFISITHRRGTMEGSDMLYGVTMQDEGISKLLALRTGEGSDLIA